MCMPGSLLTLPSVDTPIKKQDKVCKEWGILSPEVLLKLQNHEIPFTSVTVSQCHFPGTEPPEEATILIIANVCTDRR